MYPRTLTVLQQIHYNFIQFKISIKILVILHLNIHPKHKFKKTFWLTPKSSKFCYGLGRGLFTCMPEHNSSAPHSHHAQARTTCVRHDHVKNKEVHQQTLTFTPKHGCTQQVLKLESGPGGCWRL